MLKDILAISGKPGLYKLVSQTNKGIVVESIENKTKTIISNSYKVSALKDIAIYTQTGETPLAEVFKNIYKAEEGKPVSLPAKPSNDEIKSYFEKVLPEYDRNRVYVSDMKKVVKWYNLLQSHDLIKIEEENKDEKKENKESVIKEEDSK